MAIALVQEFPIDGNDRTTTNYDSVQERLGSEVPAGLRFHTAGFDEQAAVFRIFTVWESEADWQRFREDRLMPAVEPMMAAGGRPPQEHTYALHHLMEP